MDAQKVFKSTFKTLINEDYSIGIDIERNQGDIYVRACIIKSRFFSRHKYIHASNQFRPKHWKYNNKILVSNTGMKIDSNRDINRDDKKLPVAKLDVPKTIEIPTVQYDRPHSKKMLNEKHNDEKLAITLLIVGTGLMAYHFW